MGLWLMVRGDHIIWKYGARSHRLEARQPVRSKFILFFEVKWYNSTKAKTPLFFFFFFFFFLGFVFFFFLVTNSLSSCSRASPAFPQGKASTCWLASRLEEVCSSSLVFSFQLALAPWAMRIKTRPLSANHPPSHRNWKHASCVKELSYGLHLFCRGDWTPNLFFLRAVPLVTSCLSWFWRRPRV